MSVLVKAVVMEMIVLFLTNVWLKLSNVKDGEKDIPTPQAAIKYAVMMNRCVGNPKDRFCHTVKREARSLEKLVEESLGFDTLAKKALVGPSLQKLEMIMNTGSICIPSRCLVMEFGKALSPMKCTVQRKGLQYPSLD
jgi:hypothetical protein